MSNHPVNLALRFALELAGLGAMGYWGLTEHEGIARWLLGLGLPLVAAVLWGTFRVPNDPRDAPIAVPGAVRLLLEAAFFGGAVLLLALADQPRAATIMGVIVVLHYVASYDRIRWLLSQR
ncbi:MAG TPA: YrdB family protein [Aggregatilineaceae bacterium]|nr:YrdB family protein [Aggregatilineaceae bacterium]